MKIRNGFVSNSSSSSFIVASKIKPTAESLMKGIDKSSPLYFIAIDISKFLAANLKEYPIEEMEKDYDVENIPMEWKNSIDKGYKIFEARLHGDVESIEAYLYDFGDCEDITLTLD